LQKDILPIDFLFFYLKIKRLQKFFNTLSDRLAEGDHAFQSKQLLTYSIPKNALAKKATIWALVTVLFGLFVPSANPVVIPSSDKRFIYSQAQK
jgi:hypothetical protein